ncbi:hypothetical protein IF2G_01102 [Cordyceps javanica]|nr:hypothetical protein IF2G_01102 [Cordyceps javanica]
MDQGSYSRPDGRGQPSLSASSAAKNNYQVNVSRQKTKKWVEAKSQNYDGDDWGADEYDDDDDEVEPPLPLAPRGPQYGTPHAAPDMPSLHVQTDTPSQPPQQPPLQHRPYPPPQSRPPPPATAQPHQEYNTPSSARASSAAPQSAGSFQPQSASSTYPLSPRSPPDSLPSTTPQAASDKPLPFVRPSDIYRRMEGESGGGSSEGSRPSAEIAPNLSKQSSASPPKATVEPVKPHPPSPPKPARVDSYNSVYQDLTRPRTGQTSQQPAQSLPHQPEDSAAAQFAPQADAATTATDEDAKRLSTSPKLPDLARMSVFGADFFSGGFSSLSSEQIAEQEIPDVPKVAPELKVDKLATHESSSSPPGPPNASVNKTEAAPAAAAAMNNTSNKHQVIEPTVHQPAATAAKSTEPHVPPMLAETESSIPANETAARSSTETASSSHSAAPAHDITPTRPLNVRKDDSPVRSFEPPPPLQREPTFGTDTSSPVKESDVLRDEIIKTLNSPTQPSREVPGVGSTDTGTKGPHNGVRDSTYTLQDYDSYWSDADAAPAVPTQPPKVVNKENTGVAATAGPQGAAADSHDAKHTEESNPTTTQSHVQTAAAVQSKSQPATTQQRPEATVVSPTSADLRRRFSWEAEDASKPPPTALGVAPPATTTPPPVPAPVSAPAPAPAVAVTAHPPPVEPTSPPTATSSHDRQSSAYSANAATIPTVIASDNASRDSKRLSLADERAVSIISSNETSAAADGHPALTLSEPASAPALSMPRTTSANVTPFKDIVSLNKSSERVAKFNETRVAFAVMDIGLDKWLTGLHQDHPEHHSKSFNSYQPSPVSPTGATAVSQSPGQQPYYQQYLNASTPGSGQAPGRRIGGITVPSNVGGSTFGHSGNQIGTKSKELMHSAGKMGKGLFSKGKNKLRGDKGDTHPPQQTKAKQHDRSGSWAVLSSKLRTEFSSSRDHEHPRQPSLQPEAVDAAVPRPSINIAPQIPVPEPVSPILREATPARPLPPIQTSARPTAGGSQFAVGSIPTSSPLSSSITKSNQIRLVPSETTHDATTAEVPAQGPPAAEDSGVGMHSQPDESEDAPKRQSSFVGLPPIRRSSTFGMKSKARRAAERFPLDEDDSNGAPDLPASDVMEDALSRPNASQQPHRDSTNAAQTGSTSQVTNNDAVVVPQQPVSAERSPERIARQPAMAPPPQPQPMRQPIHPPMMMYPGQSGPWRLEESHLAEPLHQAKNRSGHSPISPPMNYGFDKETGQSAMMPPPPLPASVLRQRSADVPPSSAQRYPGLFAPRPDEEHPQRPVSQTYFEELANPRHSSYEYSIPGVGPPAEERGRAKRNSGIFREIGDKIARATSRDRRNSTVENRIPADVHADGASESSFGTEEMQDSKKRRSSFFNALTGRASMDQGSRHGFSTLQRSQTENVLQSSTEELGSARKRSVLGGVMSGFGVNKGGSSNAPASSHAHQQAGDDEPPITPKKKRFSGIVKAFQRPNQDRPSSGMSLEPPQSASSSQGPSPRGGITSSMPSRGKDRSDAIGQMYPASPEHNRRASFSNLLSTLMTGNKGQQHEQQHVVPAQDIGGFAARDLPQNIPPAPHQIHAADSFPTPNRNAAPALTLPYQALDDTQPLFAAGEDQWGIDRPLTSTTVTAKEAADEGGSTNNSSTPIAPATSNLPSHNTVPISQRDNATAPSEISDPETDVTENARKPSDVTRSLTSQAADDESADISRQETNVSQITPSVVTDVPRLGEQQPTPTTQYPNSPGGYLALNNRLPGVAPLPTSNQEDPQGYPKGQPIQHQQDPRTTHSGPGYAQGMGHPAPGSHYGQHAQQSMQPAFDQRTPVQQASSPKGWKGLRSKMAGQMASISQSSPNSKEKGEKSATGDKLMSAFKRLSKQQGPSDLQQQGAGQSSGSRAFAGNLGQPGMGQQQQMSPQHMHYQPLQHHPVQQQHLPPQQTFLSQGAYPNQSVQGQIPMYMQQQPQQQHNEPQYASVPIPQGYTTVHGHGNAQAPIMYSPGHQYAEHQTLYQQQGNYTGHGQPSSGATASQQRDNGVTPTQTQFQPPQADAQIREEPISRQVGVPESGPLSPSSTTQNSGSLALSPVSDELRSPQMALTREALAQQDARKDLQSHHLRLEESHLSLGPSHSNRVSQVSMDSRRPGPSPRSDESPAISHKQLQAATSSPSPTRELHVSAASPSPPAGSSSDIVSPVNVVAATETSTTPVAPLARDLTGESKGQVSDDSLEQKAELGKAKSTITAATEHVVELEDTAEARQRTLRINSQEEKIAYDPEEENPKMTATSYPGQEWNPYGEPGFGDWHE